MREGQAERARAEVAAGGAGDRWRGEAAATGRRDAGSVWQKTYNGAQNSYYKKIERERCCPRDPHLHVVSYQRCRPPGEVPPIVGCYGGLAVALQ